MTKQCCFLSLLRTLFFPQAKNKHIRTQPKQGFTIKGKRHMRETAIPLNTASATILLEETIAELDFIIVIMQLT